MTPDWTSFIRERLEGAHLEPAREAEIVGELSQHLDDRYAELLQAGAREDEARRLAMAELREQYVMNRELARVERREIAGPPLVLGAPSRRSWLRDLWHDTRYAVRMLRAHPSFTMLAVMTLALGIGCTTIVYAVIDHVLLRPIAGADRVVRIFEIDAREPDSRVQVSYPNFVDWRARSRSFQHMAIANSARFILLNGDQPERISAWAITPDYFAVVGSAPILGRAFTDADLRPNAERVAIVGYGAWQRRFGGDVHVLERTLNTTRGAYRIVGVLPADFPQWAQHDFWVPLESSPIHQLRRSKAYPVSARLKPDVSLNDARREMEAIAHAIAEENPDSKGWSAMVIPLQEQSVSYARHTLYMLLAAVGAILAIGAINVAGLLIARGSARTRELAVRVALGAGRWRIVRQLLTESVLLALGGGTIGVLLAWWSISAVVPLLPLNLPSTGAPVTIDLRVLAIAIGLSALTGMLFGAIPSLRFSRTTANDGLRESSRSTSRWGRRVGSALVLVEVALSLVLLAGAGLMVRTLTALYAVDPGFDARHVVSMSATPVMTGEAVTPRARAFFDALLARVAVLPGVEAAALVDRVHFGGSTLHMTAVSDGATRIAPVSPRTITPDYFNVMRIPLRMGRGFSAGDTEYSPKVVVINESTARALWPEGNALGQRLRFKGRTDVSEPYEVIGIVGDARHEALDRDVLKEVYHPFGQKMDAQMNVVARAAEPLAIAGLLPSQAAGLSERVLTGRAQTLDAMIDRTTLQRRNRAMLLGITAGLGLLLAAVGVFGLTAYSVGQRTREIGVRVALGADRIHVLSAVVGAMIPPIVAGTAVGFVAAWAAARTLKTFLFGVEPGDLPTFTIVSAVLLVIALIACYVPARRALRVDPVVALHAE